MGARSQSDQIKLYLFITTFARPQIERGCGDFINERHCETELRKIDALDVVLATVAGFDADVVVLRSMKITNLLRAFLSATNARHPPESPPCQTG